MENNNDFKFVNTVLKDQAQSKNQNDPEMEKLFKSLAGKEGDYVYKKKLTDIITAYDLPINVNDFFQPVGGQEELNFNEFCCLFRPEKMDENLRQTFINFIDKYSSSILMFSFSRVSLVFFKLLANSLFFFSSSSFS